MTAQDPAAVCICDRPASREPVSHELLNHGRGGESVWMQELLRRARGVSEEVNARCD